MTDHSALVAGLRELADWYEQHPEIPAPWYPAFDHALPNGPDNRPETIELIAAAIDAPVRVSPRRGHVRTSRYFSGIEFRATYIPESAMDDYKARASYEANIDTSGGAA